MITKCKFKHCVHSWAWAGPAGRHLLWADLETLRFSGGVYYVQEPCACSTQAVLITDLGCPTSINVSRSSLGTQHRHSMWPVPTNFKTSAPKSLILHSVICFKFCQIFFFFRKPVFIYIWLLPGWHWHLNVNNLMSQRQFCGICHPIKQSTTRLEIVKRQL